MAKIAAIKDGKVYASENFVGDFHFTGDGLRHEGKGFGDEVLAELKTVSDMDGFKAYVERLSEKVNEATGSQYRGGVSRLTHAPIEMGKEWFRKWNCDYVYMANVGSEKERVFDIANREIVIKPRGVAVIMEGEYRDRFVYVCKGVSEPGKETAKVKEK